MQKPISGVDFPPFFQGYVELVSHHTESNTILLHSLDAFKSDILKLQFTDFRYSYAEGKWNIGQLVRHCIDTERIFAYRALCIVRRDPALIRSFNENEYAAAAGDDFHKETLLDEFSAVRYANALFFEKLNTNQAALVGKFENGQNISLKAMACIIAGHWLHHKSILEERYGVIF